MGCTATMRGLSSYRKDGENGPFFEGLVVVRKKEILRVSSLFVCGEGKRADVCAARRNDGVYTLSP